MASNSDHHESRSREHSFPGFVLLLLVAALYLCYLLIAPFLQSILMAAVLALLFFPVQHWISRKIRNRNAAAFLSTIAVAALTALVIFLLGRALVSGLKDVYSSMGAAGENRERLSAYILHLFENVANLIGRYFPADAIDLRKAAVANAERWFGALLSVVTGAIGSVTTSLANLGISFFILFFLFRDGRALLRKAAVLLPISHEQGRGLIKNIQRVLHALIYGTLFIAILQGALTGIAFWMLGISSPALWAVITGLCALLPAIGTTIVILPAISMLFFSGHWAKGIILMVWGGAIVHPVDNFLRPYLIGGRTRLSTLFVFFSLVGGLAAFGAAGLVLGPVILATTVSLFQILREELRWRPSVWH